MNEAVASTAGASSGASPGPRQWWRHLDKSAWIWLLAIAVLVFLVVNPLARLLIVSFQQPDTGAFTLANYAAAYSRSRYVDALVNSLVLGVCAASLCVAFGVPLAWAVSRTDMPAKGLVWISILGTFVIPPYLGAVGWILLAGPNAGWLNRLVVELTGMDKGPFNIYSMTGLVLVTACYSFPYVFVFTKSALDLVSSEMEDAANILGAGNLRTTLSITLPLALPAILAAFILVFALRKRHPSSRFAIVLFFAAVFALGAYFGGDQLAERMRDFDTGLAAREQTYETARGMARDYPLFGVGPGAFDALFQLYRTSPDEYWPAQLHNDWLETRITFGWLGSFLIALAFLLVLFRWFIPGGIIGERRLVMLLWLALAGCLGQARFDFPFQVYSILYLFVVLCAVLFVLAQPARS